VIGFLGVATAAVYAPWIAAFRRGLDETGYAEGKNVTIEYRWAENNGDRLPALAADLVARKVDVIMTTGGTNGILAAKGATATIPIVGITAFDNLVATGARRRPRPRWRTDLRRTLPRDGRGGGACGAPGDRRLSRARCADRGR